MTDHNITEDTELTYYVSVASPPRSELGIFLCREDAVMPELATTGSACFDLRACFGNERLTVWNPANRKVESPTRQTKDGWAFQMHPNHRVLVPTGLKMDIPEHHVVRVYPRSSTPLKLGLMLANSVGIIDSDYIGEVFMMLINTSDTSLMIYNGDRLCQAELGAVHPQMLRQLDAAPEVKTDRGTGGLGSTGTK